MIPPAPSHPTRLVYLGTPAMAVPPLRALVAAGFQVPLVISRPDARRGRGGATSPSPVKQAALDLGLPVSHHDDEALGVDADMGVVVAYGRILRAPLLHELPLVNLHFSLLPRWRGAAPVERALLAGDTETGVCVMAVEPELDTGGVYARRTVPIGPDTTADQLRHQLVMAGTDLLVDTLEAGLGEPRPQQGEPTYAQKIQAHELELHWDQPAAHLHRLVRLGGAWTTFRGNRLKVWEAAVVPEPGPVPDVVDGGSGARAVEHGGVTIPTSDGALRLLQVQPAGKGRMSATDWANGVRPVAADFA